MGQAFDATGSYSALLLQLSVATFAVGTLMLFLPRYSPTSAPTSAHGVALSG